nr:hypothetical protein [Tanacetum cinerariifolium]
MQMIEGNGGNEFRQYDRQNVGNQNGYNAAQNVRNQVVSNAVQHSGIQNVGNQNRLIVVPGIANQNVNQNGNGNVVAALADDNEFKIRSSIRTIKCPQVVSAAKLPILNLNEFDLWKMMIEQYFLLGIVILAARAFCFCCQVFIFAGDLFLLKSIEKLQLIINDEDFFI